MRPDGSWRGPALLALHAASLWPVWRWYVARMSDGSDEPWGLAALAAAVAFSWAGRRCTPDARDPLLGLAAVLTAVYALALPFAPALVRAGIAVTALGATLVAVGGARDRLPAIAALLLLSLPLISSLQFYLGYPLRLATAAGATALLNALGVAAERAGTAMSWQGQTVLVDAPCSGVKMLWVGLVLACVLAAQRRVVRRAPFAVTLCLTLAAVLLGNSLRAAALFLVETRLVSVPPLAHDVVGVAVFLLTGILILAIERRSHHVR